MHWPDLAAVFILGLAGSGHCIGMCGAFGLAVSAGAGKGQNLVARHVAYQLGKGSSYAFLGVLLLLVTSWIKSEWPVLQLQRVLGVVVGALMVFTGVLLLLERRLPARLAHAWNGSAFCQSLSALWQSASLYRSVLVGWLNGFLPCGLSLMALLFLTRNGSVLETIAGAFVFTAGTLPGFLAVGWLGQRFSPVSRRRLMRASGVILVIFGLLTMVRDEPMVHGVFHRFMPELPGASPEHAPHH